MTKESGASGLKEVFSGMIQVKQIEVHGNTRREFNGEAMKELTENIRRNGVLVPILLVKTGKDSYRLVAGERRLRAAIALALREVPARVIEAEGAKLKELQLFENLHRQDLGPIEEARAFKQFLEGGKNTIEGLAKQVDKSVKYVTRSVRLLELPKAAIGAIEKGLITPEHGHQILRAPEDKRDKLVEFALAQKWGGALPTIHELRQEIERRLERDLSQASFPTDKEFAGEKACAACPFNTGNQNVLFEGAQAGKCTNGACFSKKTFQALKEFKEGAAKHFTGLKFIGYGAPGYGAETKVKGAAVLSPEEAKSEKVKALIKQNPEKFGFAVIKPAAHGGKSGPRAVVVCQDEELLAKGIRKPAPQSQHVMSPEEREREEFLQDAEMTALFAEATAKLKAVGKKQIVDIVLALNGSDAAYKAMDIEESKDLSKTLAKLSEKDLLRLAWLCTVDAWEADKAFAGLGISADKLRKEARKIALVEWEKARAEAQAKEAETAGKKA